MAELPDHCIDMVLTDLPYGMTNCKWDNIIPFDKLWLQIKRVLKTDGAAVFTSIQPFTTKLINSNIKDFKYCWYWIKNGATGFCFSKYQPMRNVEDLCVFYNKSGTYNPQGLVKLDKPIKGYNKPSSKDGVYKSNTLSGKDYEVKYKNYPKQTFYFDREAERLHPTQKPQALFEYLIQTYTNVDDTVLDCCMGSGTTAVACIATGRRFVGFETDKGYYDRSIERIKQKASDI